MFKFVFRFSLIFWYAQSRISAASVDKSLQMPSSRFPEVFS